MTEWIESWLSDWVDEWLATTGWVSAFVRLCVCGEQEFSLEICTAFYALVWLGKMRNDLYFMCMRILCRHLLVISLVTLDWWSLCMQGMKHTYFGFWICKSNTCFDSKVAVLLWEVLHALAPIRILRLKKFEILPCTILRNLQKFFAFLQVILRWIWTNNDVIII